MNEKQLDLELNKHLEEVISSRKVSLEDTRHNALNLWNLICDCQKHHKSRNIVIQHYSDGKVITTMFSEQIDYTSSGKKRTSIINDKLIDYWPDPELLEMLSIIAGNSDVKGKCRLSENVTCKELHFDFK